MNYYLFYGSLKSNHYNFDRFGVGSQKFIKKINLNGYELYSLGAFPAICVGNGSVVCELQSVSNDAMKFIESMERGAGYVKQTIKLDDNITASIFVMDKRHLANCKKVESGNW